jgi:hypothetical protein
MSGRLSHLRYCGATNPAYLQIERRSLEEMSLGHALELEIRIMKYRTPLIATAFMLIAIGSGYAVTDRRHFPIVGDGVAVPIAQSAAAKSDSARVYCYNGVKSGQYDLYRGWICVPESKATAQN